MKNISSLQKAADKERLKAEGDQREARHQRDIGHDEAARSIEDRALLHDNTAQDYEAQLQDLRNQTAQLEQQREAHEQNIQREQRAIDDIDQQLKVLTGESHTLF